MSARTSAGASASHVHGMRLGSRALRSRFLQLLIGLAVAVLLAMQFGGFLLTRASEPGENIVVNGSFEEPILEDVPWAYLHPDEVPGWSAILVDDEGAAQIEIMRGDRGPADDGAQYAELDANANTAAIYQDLQTIPGTVYRIEFVFSPRPFRPEVENNASLDWGGEEIISSTELSGDGTDLTTTDWREFSRIVVATSDETRLQFNYEGLQNSYGVLLDSITVAAATCQSTGFGTDWNNPESWECGAGGIGLLGIVPGVGNDVVISDGHTVQMNGDQSVNNLTIESGGILDNTGGHELTIYGDFTLDGEYLISQNGDEKTKFAGDKDQKIKGSKDPAFNNMDVDKKKKEDGNDSELDVEKKLKVEKQLSLKEGLTKIGYAELNNVTIEQNAKLEGKDGTTKKFKGDKTVNGDYDPKLSKDEFTGNKDQKVTGDLDKKLLYHELLIKKQDKEKENEEDEPEKSSVKFEKEIEVKEKTEIEEGKMTVDTAKFKDVEVKMNGELEGTPEKTKTYTGNKKVDGKYTHNNSKDEFTGSEKQVVSGGTEKEEELKYKELLIKKEQEQQEVEFQKKIAVENKTLIEKGKTKVGDAHFKDIEITKDGELEGTPEKTKTYTGEKIVDGKYTHNDSKDEFTGKEDQKVTSKDEEKKKEEIKYKELLIKKEKENEEQQKSQLEFEKSLNVEEKTTIEEGILKTNTVFGEVIIEEDGELILDEGDNPTEVQGNWTNNGVFVPGDGTVIFNGSQQQSIGGSSLTTFSNVTFDNDTVISSHVRVDGTLKITADLSLEGDGEIEQGENFNLEVGSGALPGLGCDPGNSRLTGGGWIQSDAGAYLPDPNASGKANFSLSVHCGADGSQPTGNLGFNLKPMKFKATAFDSMIVLDNRATVTGFGTINGDGDYGFALVAVEGGPGNSGDPNMLSMIIWDTANGETVYDSQVNDDGPTDTGGGNIKIHQSGNGGPPMGHPKGGPPGQR